MPLCRESLEPHATQLMNLLTSSGVAAAGPGGAGLLNDELAFNALRDLNSALEFAGLHGQALAPAQFTNGPLNGQGIEPAANAVRNRLEELKSNPNNFTPPAVPITPQWWWDLASCDRVPLPNLVFAVHSAMDQSSGGPPDPQGFQRVVDTLNVLRERRRKISDLARLPGVGRVVRPHETAAPAAKREEYAKLRIQVARQIADLEVLKIELGF